VVAASSEDGVRTAVIVTGGGRGIGRAISLRLLRESPVVVVGRTPADLDAVCSDGLRAGGQVVACVGDVADSATAAAALKLVRSRGWVVGHLVCNAGMGKGGPTAEFDPDLWRRIFEVNVHGCFYLVRACLPDMLARGTGAITIIGSLAGVAGVAYDAAYTASKHALVGFARSLALEYGKRGLTVTALCPSFVESEMTRRTIRGVMRRHGLSEAEAGQRVAARCPAKRILPAEEIAEAVALIGAGDLPAAVALATRGGYPVIGGPEVPLGVG
jgi:meso-butanediol dehydrogenase / (S,S)-butanediol dehydrogenase / diacetyl reductase